MDGQGIGDRGKKVMRMRISIPVEAAYHLINHGPCNLITTGDGTARNVAPINWTMPLLDDPPLMMSVIEHGIYTEELVNRSGQFVINVVGELLAPKVLACGKCHGGKVDKFAAIGLTPVACSKVKPPYLKESAAHIECEVINRHPYEGVTIYVGKVLYAAVEQEYWTGKSLDVAKVRSIHHLDGPSFAISERVVTVT